MSTSAQRDSKQRLSRLAVEIFAPPCRKCAFASVYEYRQLRAKEKAMTRTIFALAIAVVGAVFSFVSGTSQAAPIAPLSAVAPHDSGSAKPVSWHEGRGGDHRKRSGFGRGGIFAKFGHFQSMLGMLAGSGDMGGMASMLGGMGGSGGMGGLTSMLGGMAGSSDMGGMASMLGGMGGSGGMGGMASMLGSMGGTGGTGGVTSMLGGMAGSGGAQSTTGGQVSQSARQACTPDAMRLCSDYIPDVGKITACMRAKSAQLSEPCRAAMNSEGAATSRLAGRGVASPVRSRGLAGYGGSESAANFSGGQSSSSFEAGDDYDRAGAVQSLGGGGGFDIGRMIGMARSFGFGQRGGW
jgi:hypothetical protein